MTTSDPYPPSRTWAVRDSDNLGKITAAQGVISGLLGVLVILSVAMLVLGIIGYMKVVDRLDNIEKYTGATSNAVTAPPVVP